MQTDSLEEGFATQTTDVAKRTTMMWGISPSAMESLLLGGWLAGSATQYNHSCLDEERAWGDSPYPSVSLSYCQPFHSFSASLLVHPSWLFWPLCTSHLLNSKYNVTVSVTAMSGTKLLISWRHRKFTERCAINRSYNFVLVCGYLAAGGLAEL